MPEHLRKPKRLNYLSSAELGRVETVRTTNSNASRVKRVEQYAVEGGTKFKMLYRTSRWLKLREEVLKRDMYTCQLCGAVGDVAGKLVCDHVRGHPPDETEEMFWAGPFQCVCYTCHNTVRAKEDNERKRKWLVK